MQKLTHSSKSSLRSPTGNWSNSVYSYKPPSNSCELYNYICSKDPQALARARHVSPLPRTHTKFPNSGLTWKSASPRGMKASKNQAMARVKHLTWPIFLGPGAKEKKPGWKNSLHKKSLRPDETADLEKRDCKAARLFCFINTPESYKCCSLQTSGLGEPDT